MCKLEMTLVWHFCFIQEEMEKSKNSWHNDTFLVWSSNELPLCREKLFCGCKLLTYPAPETIYPEESDILSVCNTNAIQMKGQKDVMNKNCKEQGSHNFSHPSLTTGDHEEKSYLKTLDAFYGPKRKLM